MRHILYSLAFAGFFVPAPAFAGGCGQAASFTISCEQGVKVYRAKPSEAAYAAHAGLQQNYRQAKQEAAARAEMSLQALKLAAQDKKISDLDARLQQAEHAKTGTARRSHYGYGRRYYGNNRFFGSNGFIGNSNFSGASPRVRPVRRAKRVRRSYKKHKTH